MAEWVRRLRRASQARVREASGDRPPQLRGGARKGWTRQDERGEIPGIGRAKSPLSESRKHGSEAQNRRDGALRGGRPCATGAAPQGIDSLRNKGWRKNIALLSCLKLGPSSMILTGKSGAYLEGLAFRKKLRTCSK